MVVERANERERQTIEGGKNKSKQHYRTETLFVFVF